MGHYDDCYAEEAAKATKYKRETLTSIAEELKTLMLNLRRTNYYNELSTVHTKLQGALFWLKNDIP